jgi:prepilin-type N-terminal cleavage/methylation domain-containing protein
MKKKGFTLVELLVVIAIIAMLLAILMPALGKVRALAQRLVCGTSLGGLGKAMSVYSNDNQEQYPYMGGVNCGWQESTTTNFKDGGMTWDTDITKVTPGNGQQYVTKATVTSSLYLLVKYADVSTGQFVCKAGNQKKFDLSLVDKVSSPTTVKELVQLWDFGPAKGTTKTTTVWQFCSYSYQMPYTLGGGATSVTSAYPLTAASPAGCAVLADRNPWFLDDGTFEKATSTVTSTSTTVYVVPASEIDSSTGALRNKANAKYCNSKAHNLEGQNVLYMDSHTAFESTPFVGVDEDNIYAPWAAASATIVDKKTGPSTGVQNRTDPKASVSQNIEDSFLAD